MNYGRMGIINLFETKPEPKSEYVIVDTSVNTGGVQIAQSGGFLEKMAGEYFICKRIVAENLGLSIISEWPVVCR